MPIIEETLVKKNGPSQNGLSKNGSLQNDSLQSLDRRKFLAAGTTGLLAAAIPAASFASSSKPPDMRNWPPSNPANSEATPGAGSQSTGAKRKIPIGVFDPVYADLSMDAML